MSVNPELAVGATLNSQSVAWTQKDLLLYHAGIGGKKDELNFLYELDQNWQAFPTYPLCLGLKGDTPELTNFAEMVSGGRATPGLPQFDPTKLVHAEQSIEIVRPFPKSASKADGFHLTKRCVGCLDKGKGTVVEYENNLVDKNGTVYAKMNSSTYFFVKNALNGYQKSIRAQPPAQPSAKLPDRAPDAVITEKTSDEQALIYRLAGDTNPLHADPKIGSAIGFGGVILHGLCSYGFAARAIVKAAAKGNGSSFKYMYGRFSSPVRPGDTLETSMWFTKVPGGTKVDFVEKVKETGKTCLSGGVALIVDDGLAPKL